MCLIMLLFRNVQDKVDSLKHEMNILKEKYESMDHDGGRYNTAAHVLQERINELELKESFRRR
tara:strand:- start:415 stop:603 length:189 start_codon:yes stop_codon:yes gene_type:complete